MEAAALDNLLFNEKAHGGDIKVETKEGEGSTFINKLAIT